MLKPRLRILQVAQVIWATVEENHVNNEVLVSYQGDLLRVQNQSHAQFRIGQRVRLEVVATLPLEFRLKPVTGSDRSILDISI